MRETQRHSLMPTEKESAKLGEGASCGSRSAKLVAAIGVASVHSVSLRRAISAQSAREKERVREPAREREVRVLRTSMFRCSRCWGRRLGDKAFAARQQPSEQTIHVIATKVDHLRGARRDDAVLHAAHRCLRGGEGSVFHAKRARPRALRHRACLCSAKVDNAGCESARAIAGQHRLLVQEHVLEADLCEQHTHIFSQIADAPIVRHNERRGIRAELLPGNLRERGVG